jgi:kynureninase
MAESLTRDGALRLDAQDELAPFRARFHLPPDRIYLDGNSLGLCSVDAEEALARSLADWKRLAIEGWTEGDPAWFTLAERLAELTAPLVGASAHEVIVANSTTVNLHQLLATFFRPEGPRRRVLVDALAFPSDAYAVESHVRLRGLDPARDLVVIGDRWGDRTIDEDAVVAAMTDDVAFAVLPAVLYTTGQLLDVARITAAARDRGVFLAWDLSHSIGAVPHRLHDWGCDAAFWCSYKYLNGGPGAAGGLFVHDRHFPPGHARDATARLRPGLAGWFGSDKGAQFDMESRMSPAYGAGALQIGTPALFAMAPLVGALAIVREAGMDRIRAKSLRMTRYLMDLVRERIPAAHGLGFANPLDDARRGGHVAVTHPDAERIAVALRRAGVVPDHRRPDIVRLAPSALYTTYAECFDAVERLRVVMEHPETWRGIAPAPGVR